MKILTSYNKPYNIAEVESSSYNNFVNQQEAALYNIARGDATTPYTYQEWIERHIGVIPGQEYSQYNDYLKGWYDSKKQSIQKTQDDVKQNYIDLLKQLSVVFKDEALKNYISNFDWNDDIELEQSIPFFARKLKEIAIYLSNKRENIGNAKVRYNTYGATNAIEKLFYEYLLKAFTKRNYVINVPEVSVWNNLPELSAVNSGFLIIVEELYDDTTYFDRDSSLSASQYFNITSLNVSSYFDIVDFTGDLNWLYNIGVNTISANITLVQKYIGENQYDTGSLLVSSTYPYANLLNRHYPTYASMSYMGDLYSKRESGGYLIPKMLGTNTFIAKNVDNIVIGPGVYRNLETNTSDIGLTRTDQIEPVSTVNINNNWMKGTITSQSVANIINGDGTYQNFIPYRTKYEDIKHNQFGLLKQDDLTDPWVGENDNIWSNTYSITPNWRKQPAIEEWYTYNTMLSSEIFKWKTDIFGNQYILTKDINNDTIYNQKNNKLGILWIRNDLSGILLGSSCLPSLYETIHFYENIDVTGCFIKNIDVWYDTIMIQTTNNIYISKIDYSFDDNNMSIYQDSIQTFSISGGNIFGGTWLSEKDMFVTFCTLVSSGDGQIRPVLRKLDLNTSNLTYLYNLTSTVTNFSSIFVNPDVDLPVFTFNSLTNTYNISTIMKDQSNNKIFDIVQFNIKQIGEYVLDSVNIIKSTG